MKSKIVNICKLFKIKGKFKRYEIIKEGNINNTYKVYFKEDKEVRCYVLQRINTLVFNEPIKIMENIISITKYIKDKLIKENKDYTRLVLEYITSNDNKAYVIDDDEFWRCYLYIDNSFTISYTDDLELIKEAGKAFGEFQLYLDDYKISEINEAIKDFHNIEKKYQDFERIIKIERKRVKENLELIKEYEEIKELAFKIKEKNLPYRITHNDTKVNNVLFDCNTRKHLAVIDLDTVSKGVVAFDFGDAIRSIASSSREDEKDENKIYLDLKKFEAFSKGFLDVIKDKLTKEEKESLVEGVITITIELGLRFLSDYFENDRYFKIDYKEHNLVRSKCQLKLVKDMINKQEKMREIVNKCCN